MANSEFDWVQQRRWNSDPASAWRREATNGAASAPEGSSRDGETWGCRETRRRETKAMKREGRNGSCVEPLLQGLDPALKRSHLAFQELHPSLEFFALDLLIHE